MNINFHKSELFLFCEAQTDEAEYAMIFMCEHAKFFVSYMGVPIHYCRLVTLFGGRLLVIINL
jgi:hypothetical protein